MKQAITTSFFILSSILCFSQMATYDVAIFTPPKEWKKIVNEGVVMYSSTNNSTGSFCLISLYKTVDGAGGQLFFFL